MLRRLPVGRDASPRERSAEKHCRQDAGTTRKRPALSRQGRDKFRGRLQGRRRGALGAKAPEE